MTLEIDNRTTEVLKSLSKKSRVKASDFVEGTILGVGTFGVVKQVFYKKKSS